MSEELEKKVIELIEKESGRLMNFAGNEVRRAKDPAVIIVLGQMDEKFIKAMSSAYDGTLMGVAVPEMLFIANMSEVSTLSEKLGVVISNFVNRGILSPGENMNLSLGFVAQMEDELLKMPALADELDKFVMQIREMNVLLHGWKFFGIFDVNKTVKKGYDYGLQFRNLFEIHKKGIIKEIFHMEKDEFLWETVAKSVAFEMAMETNGTRTLGEHYEWRFLWCTMTMVPQQFLCNILLDLCRSQKIYFDNLPEQKKREAMSDLEKKIREALKSEINNRFIIISNAKAYNAFLDYMPRLVTRERRFLTETLYLETVPDEYRDGIMKDYIDEAKKQLTEEGFAKRVLLGCLSGMHFVDMGSAEKDAIADLIREMIRSRTDALKFGQTLQLSEKARIELELYLLREMGTDRMLYDCMQELIQRVTESKEILLKIRKEFGKNQETGDLRLDFSIPLLVNLNKSINSLVAEHWDEIRKILENSDIIPSLIESFVVNSRKSSEQQNAYLAHKSGNADYSNSSGLLLAGMQKDVLRSIQLGSYVLEEPNHCKNGVLISLCYTLWNSEEALYKYYGEVAESTHEPEAAQEAEDIHW